MRAIGRVAWSDPIATPCLYFLTPESFETITVHELDGDGNSVRQFQHIASDPVGHTWAKGRLKVGDILLCDKLNGDRFYDWYLVDYTDYQNKEGVHMRLVPYKFGAYRMSAKKLDGLTMLDYALLLAGQEVEVMTQLPK